MQSFICTVFLLLFLVYFFCFNFSWLFVYIGRKCTLFEILIDFLFLFFNNLLDFILNPNIVSCHKCRIGWYNIPFTLFNHWFEGTLNINFMFDSLVFLLYFFLRLDSLGIEIIPNRFSIESVWILNFIVVFEISSWWCSDWPLGILLWRFDDFPIGFKVLLLIKVHYCLKVYYYSHYVII